MYTLVANTLFTQNGIHWIFRWWHVMGAIMWMGLLYYFNYVQVPSFAKMEPGHRNGAIDQLVPKALWYFRWAAVLTVATGIGLIGITPDAYKGAAGTALYIGVLFGLVMFANVWLVIWPNQKKVIANARGVLAGQPANPDIAKIGRAALLASRTNAIFSIPLVMFMTGATHFFGTVEVNSAVLWIFTLVVIVVLELNALGLIGGPNGPLTKPLEKQMNIAHIGVPISIIFIALWVLL